jgi:MFS family permease
MTLRENLGALAERDFRLFLIGHIASLMGSAMMAVATPFIVFDLGGNTSDVGIAYGVLTATMVVTLLVGGVLADRFSRRRLMIAADVLEAVVQLAFAILLLSGQAQLWHVFVAMGLGGIGVGIFEPAIVGLIPQAVSAPRLQGANALRSISWSVADVAGPALAGAVIALSGLGEVVLLDAISFLVSVFALSAMRLRPAGPEETEPEHFLAEMRAGWQEFRSRRWLWTVVGAFTILSALVYAPFIVLGATIANDDLGGPGAWAAILSLGGCGAVVGGILALRVRPRFPIFTGMASCLLYVPVLVLLAVKAPVVAIGLAMALGEVGFSMFDTLWTTAMQRAVPEQMLSRVSAYDLLGSTVAEPGGYALAGPAAVLLGVGGALGAAAGVLIVVTLLTLRFGRLREVVAT